MAIHTIHHEQEVAASLDAVWDFFSQAKNLQAITPEHMRFRVTSRDMPDEIYPGQIITYKVSPLLGIPLFWMTEISHVVPKKLFVDEQRRGPYRLWHHQHHFRELPGGRVLMTDIVHYQLPMSFLGELAHVLFVKAQLSDIFEYRKQKIAHIFP